MPNAPATLTRTSCDTYTIENTSDEIAIGYVVEELVDGEFVASYTSGSISAGDSVEHVFDSDGIYQITIGWYGTPLTSTDVYVVIIYCTVEACVLNFLRTILCELDTDCAACTAKFEKVLYYYNALNQAWFVFLAMQNDIYVNNYLFTGTLTEAEITNLSTASDLITQMENYCSCLSLITDSTGSSGCGCG